MEKNTTVIGKKRKNEDLSAKCWGMLSFTHEKPVQSCSPASKAGMQTEPINEMSNMENSINVMVIFFKLNKSFIILQAYHFSSD